MIIKKILHLITIERYRIIFEDLPFEFSTNNHTQYLTSCPTNIHPAFVQYIEFKDLPEKLRNTLEDPFFELHCLKVWANTLPNPNSYIAWKESVNFNY